MAENNTPAVAAPAAPAQPITPAPSAAMPRNDKGQFVKTDGVVPVQETRKPSISAKKALGLDDDPGKMAQSVVDSTNARERARTPVTNLPAPAPEPAATPAPAPVVEPAATPAPAPAPVAAAPAQPAKIKIGDKEYSEAELQEQLRVAEEAKAAKTAQQEVAPAPAAAQPQVTPEQRAEMETKWINEYAAQLPITSMTEQEVDTILAGGADAVKVLDGVRRRDAATAILHARKSLADPINEKFAEIEQAFQSLQPLVQQHEQLEVYQTEQAFIAKHTDFKPGWPLEKARAVAKQAFAQHRDAVSKMTREQFIDYVAAQTDRILKAEWKALSGSDNWREGIARVAAQNAPAPQPAVAPVATPAAAPAAAPAPQPPPVRPPAANAPASVPGTVGKNFHKSVAASLH